MKGAILLAETENNSRASPKKKHSRNQNLKSFLKPKFFETLFIGNYKSKH